MVRIVFQMVDEHTHIREYLIEIPSEIYKLNKRVSGCWYLASLYASQQTKLCICDASLCLGVHMAYTRTSTHKHTAFLYLCL